MKYYYVYILTCADNSFYIGMTNNLERRLKDHSEGVDSKSYTFNRRPVIMSASFEFNNVFYAISFEKQIKRWSRAKKEALSKGDYELLRELSKRYGDMRKSDDGSSASP